jgi:hypothetical protein
MKKSYAFTLIFSLFLSITMVYGQGYTFRVLANKGQNQVKKDGKTQPLKTGASLSATDELIVGEGAYIGLMHKTGKTIEVRDAGSQKVSDLEKKVNAKKTSVASRYAQFIASKMEDDEGTSYRRNMNATGAVSRAVGDAAVNIMLPSQITFLGDQAIIRWNEPSEVEGAPTYIVSLSNIFDQEIYSTETNENKVSLDFTDKELQSEDGMLNLYLLTVSVKGNDELTSGDPIGLKRAEEGEMEDVKANYESLKTDVPDDSPLNKLIYASFFEENGLLLDALTKYEEAIEMSPEVEDFKQMRDEFLVKYELVPVGE